MAGRTWPAAFSAAAATAVASWKPPSCMRTAARDAGASVGAEKPSESGEDRESILISERSRRIRGARSSEGQIARAENFPPDLDLDPKMAMA